MPRSLRPSRTRSGDAGVRAVLAGAASAAAAEVEDSLAVTPDPTAAAFFDVDNTMIRGASIYFFGKGMAGRGLITTKDLLRFGWQQLQFRVRGKEDLDAVAEARDKALGDMRALAGVAKLPRRVKCAMLGWDALEEAEKKLAAQ